MVKVFVNQHSNLYIKGTITLPIRAYLTSSEARELTDEKALEMLDKARQYYAEHQEGAEIIANGEIKLVCEDENIKKVL